MRRLRKRTWTSAENEVLKAYIDKHGEGNWVIIKRNTGLSRSSNTIRTHWMNNLRPNLKKGSFTEQEKQRVIELYATMGNKWSLIAAQLPGRTGNEIMTFLNSRFRSLQAGRKPEALDSHYIHSVMEQLKLQIDSNSSFIEEITARCSSLEQAGEHSLAAQRDSLTRAAYNETKHIKKRIESTSLFIKEMKTRLEQARPQQDSCDALRDSYFEQLRQQQNSLRELYSKLPTLHPNVFNFLPNTSGHTNFGSNERHKSIDGKSVRETLDEDKDDTK